MAALRVDSGYEPARRSVLFDQTIGGISTKQDFKRGEHFPPNKNDVTQEIKKRSVPKGNLTMMNKVKAPKHKKPSSKPPKAKKTDKFIPPGPSYGGNVIGSPGEQGGRGIGDTSIGQQNAPASSNVALGQNPFAFLNNLTSPSGKAPNGMPSIKPFSSSMSSSGFNGSSMGANSGLDSMEEPTIPKKKRLLPVRPKKQKGALSVVARRKKLFFKGDGVFPDYDDYSQQISSAPFMSGYQGLI